MILTHWTQVLLGRPWVSALILFAVTALLASSATRLKVDFTFTSFMGSDAPQFTELEAHVERWGPDDTTLIVLVEADRSLLLGKNARALSLTAADLQNQSGVALARDPLASPVVTGGALLEVTTLGELEESARADAAAAFVPALISRDHTRALIFCELALDGDDILAYLPVLREVRQALAGREDGLRYSVAGVPAVRADLVENITSDQVIFVAISLAIAALLNMFLFRRLWAIATCALVAALPALWLLGVMAAAGEPFGLLSQVYPALIPVIAIADAIHVVTRFIREGREADLSDRAQRQRAIVAAMTHTGPACFLTTTTTAVGFGSLMIADLPVLNRFGAYAALGCLFAFFSVLVALPLGLNLARKLPPPRQQRGRALRTIAVTSMRYRWVVIAGGLMLAALAATVVPSVSIDNHLSDSLIQTGDVARAQRVVDEHLGGVLSLQLSVTATEDGRLLAPDVLRALLAVEDSVVDGGVARWTLGHARPLVTLNKAIVGEHGPPRSIELAEQLLGMADTAALARVLSDDRRHARIFIGVPDVGGVAFARFERDLSRKIATHFDRIEGVEVKITGMVPLAYRGFNDLARELAVSLALAIAVIAVVMLMMFRSLSICLVSALPNLLPLILTLVLMWALGWNLDPASTVVFSVALGIAVDDTIHVLARVREQLRLGDAPEPAIEAAIASTGDALVTTSILLGVTFATFAFSAFPIPRVFGALMAWSIFTALILDVTLLPALLSVAGSALRPLVGAAKRGDSSVDVDGTR